MINALQYLDVRWAIHPTDWYGFYSILDWLPLSATLIMGAVILSPVLSIVDDG